MPRRPDAPGDGPVTVPSPEADELVTRARAGDADAFADLFRAMLPMVHGNLYRRCGDPTLAEDLASDVFMRALRSLPRFTGTSQDFIAWVMRIARNRFLDHIKSGRVRWEMATDELPITVSRMDAEQEAVDRIEAADLRDALTALTPEQQEVVELRFLEGLSVAEVAAIVGRAEGAVKALQHRAMRSLARHLRSAGVITQD